MNIFQLKTQPEGIERIQEFITENFVCIGYSRLDDLTGLEKDDIREKLNKEYNWVGSQLGNHLGIVNAFVSTMNKDDLILISEGEWVHVGKVGNYYYDEKYIDDGMCHRRDVSWLLKVQKHQLNEYVKELLRNRSVLTKFKHPIDIAELNNLFKEKNIELSANRNEPELIDKKKLNKALAVLVAALDSESEEIRVIAANSILNYSK